VAGRNNAAGLQGCRVFAFFDGQIKGFQRAGAEKRKGRRGKPGAFKSEGARSGRNHAQWQNSCEVEFQTNNKGSAFPLLLCASLRPLH
jgi:hypothetical protein